MLNIEPVVFKKGMFQVGSEDVNNMQRFKNLILSVIYNSERIVTPSGNRRSYCMQNIELIIIEEGMFQV